MHSTEEDGIKGNIMVTADARPVWRLSMKRIAWVQEWAFVWDTMVLL